ncbi:ATP-binding protein [Fictibacillus sp. Mic-4]|uniref:ATP-binding protein n=1 Tax=Fictibacillus sp. Mic-4 TaxID=3132826 RepID=UPI003CFAF3E2
MAGRRIKSIKMSDYFSYLKNKMVTYRIIPHLNVTNNQNTKLWRMLHKMYEIYDSIPTRLKRNSFKFTYREKDTIWFDIVFRQREGRRSIEFYASTSEVWAKKFREILENYMKVTIEEVGSEVLRIPEGNVLREIRLARHDIFSLQTDAREQTSPISSIMSALNDISQDGDFARLSVCTETENRQKWLKNASWALEKLSKGNVPQRGKITASKVSKSVKTGIVTLVNEVYDLLDDTLNAISNVFFKSDKEFKKKPIVDKKQALINEISSGQLSSKSMSKANQPVWKTHIRIAAKTEDPLRSELITNTIGSAFSELSGDNELLPIKIKFKARKKEIIEELNTLHLSSRTKADGDPNLLSCEELSKVSLQLPTATVQQKFEDALSVNRKVETDIPSVLATDKGIMVGHAEIKGEQLPISIPMSNLDETFRSYGFVGSPRMGKDTLMKNMIVEGCMHHNISTFVIDAIMEDGERGLADGIRDALPPEKIIDLDLSDEEYFPPMDLTEIVRKLGARRGADRFANELIDFFGDVAEMGQSRAILRSFAKASKGSIFNIKLMLENEDIRLKRIKELRAQGQDRLANELDKWTTTYKEKIDKNGNVDIVVDRDGQRSLEAKASSILYRLEEFLGTESTFNIFAQDPHPELDFEKWMKEGKVIILRIPNRKLGPLPTRTLAHWITLKVFMTKLLMNPNEAKTFIVFNEPHQYLTLGLKNLMQRIVLEGPKWRLSGLFAFHHFGLLKHGLDEDLTAAGINWFLFANDNKKVFETLSEQLKPTFDVETAMLTEAYHAIVIVRFNGRRQNPFLIKALAPPSKRYPEHDNSFLTKRHARQYGRHWQEIEKMIAEKEKILA